MKNLLFLILFTTTTFLCQGQFFQATIDKDGNDLIFLLRANPGGGDITTNWSDTEFFVRWPDTAPAFNFGAITVNTTGFPGVSIPNNGEDAQGSEVGFTNNWFGASYSATASSTYTDGVEYEIFRVTLDIPAANVDFELVHNEWFSPHYLSLISGTGSDLSNVAGIMFYSNNAMICPSGNNCPASTPGSNHVDEGLDAPLPVELLIFTATKLKKEVALDWQTASERKNAGFEIQKSSDGGDWKILGFVEGEGSSRVLNDYQFVDKRPIEGTNYYRLKQIDFDGAIEFSKVVSVYFSGANKIRIYPNPTNGRIHIIGQQTGKLKVINSTGMLIKEQSFSEPEFDISALSSGIYFIQIISGEQKIFTQRIFKE
jgi:hypothetical protein